MLGVGYKFPAFNLTALIRSNTTPDKAFRSMKNSDFAGSWKLFFFWPKDFTFVCPTEISAFGEMEEEFRSRNCRIIGASIDSEFVHLAWFSQDEQLRKNVNFPVLSDIKRELSEALGILDPREGVSQRATFILDPDDTIRFVSVTDLSVGRNSEEVLRVLDALQSGGLCPVNWKKGDKTL